MKTDRLPILQWNISQSASQDGKYTVEDMSNAGRFLGSDGIYFIAFDDEISAVRQDTSNHFLWVIEGPTSAGYYQYNFFYIFQMIKNRIAYLSFSIGSLITILSRLLPCLIRQISSPTRTSSSLLTPLKQRTLIFRIGN